VVVVGIAALAGGDTREEVVVEVVVLLVVVLLLLLGYDCCWLTTAAAGVCELALTAASANMMAAAIPAAAGAAAAAAAAAGPASDAPVVRVGAGVDLATLDTVYPTLRVRIVSPPGADARLSGATGGRILVAAAPFRRGDVVFEEVATVWCSRATRTALCETTPAAARAFMGGLQWVAPFDALRQLAPECLPATAAASSVGPGTAAAARLCASLLAAARQPPLPPGDDRDAVLRALLLKLLFDANSFAAHVPLHGAAAAGAPPPPLAPGTAVGLLVAMMNHACCPNVAHAWRWDVAAGAPVVSVVAVRDIGAGEELCTRYLDVDTAPKHVRRKTLRERYGFTCQCVRCAARVDDAMAFRCGSCAGGAVLGWSNTCTACGASTDLAADELVEERSAVLTALVPPAPAPTGLIGSRAAAAGTDDGVDDGADEAGAADVDDAAAAATAASAAEAAALEAVLALLAPRDAAAHGLLRRRAITRLREGDVAGALADAASVSAAVAFMPYLSPATAMATHLLYADAAVAGGDIPAACAAYAAAADLEAQLCHPLRARYYPLPAASSSPPPLAAALRALVDHPPAPGLPSLRELQLARAPATSTPDATAGAGAAGEEAAAAAAAAVAGV